MKAELQNELLHLWQEHRGASLGLMAGVIVAICMLIFGFWQTLFVLFFGFAGLWLGNEYDNKADAWLDFKAGLARFLPVSFQRYRGRNGADYTDYDFRKER